MYIIIRRCYSHFFCVSICVREAAAYNNTLIITGVHIERSVFAVGWVRLGVEFFSIFRI